MLDKTIIYILTSLVLDELARCYGANESSVDHTGMYTDRTRNKEQADVVRTAIGKRQLDACYYKIYNIYIYIYINLL